MNARCLVARLEAVSDWQLFVFCVLWVVVGGLLLQLLVLPHLVPSAHWGHGLIANLDSPGFHVTAVEQSERIQQQGWNAWWFFHRDRNDPSVALASALYTVIYPEPWAVLPVNGMLFGIAVVAVRRLLEVLCHSRGGALAAVIPFFVFPSFIPIWGQLQKDLNAGTGLSLVLCALVLAGNTGRRSAIWLAMTAAAGMGLVWLSRPYAVTLMAGATFVFVTVAFFSRGCQRVRLSAVALVVVLAALLSPEGWTGGKTDRAFVASLVAPPAEEPGLMRPWPSLSWASVRLPRTRRVDASLPRLANCLPRPSHIFDQLLYSLCYVREGFVMEATNASASSGYDYDIRLRSAEDFIAYGPRAAKFVVLEPGPDRWRGEQTTVGKLGSFFVPLEMSTAYLSFLLAFAFAGKRLARPVVLAVMAFCVTYTFFYVVAMPQMGTLYRMRAFAFAIVVSTALAVTFAKPKAAK